MTSIQPHFPSILLAQAIETDNTNLERTESISVDPSIQKHWENVLKNSKEKSDYWDPKKFSKQALGLKKPSPGSTLTQNEIDATIAEYIKVAPENAKKLRLLYESCKDDSRKIYLEIRKQIPTLDKLISPELSGYVGKQAIINEAVSDAYAKKLNLYQMGNTEDVTESNAEALAQRTVLQPEFADLTKQQRFLLMIYLLSIDRSQNLLSNANFTLGVHYLLKNKKNNDALNQVILHRNAAIMYTSALGRLINPDNSGLYQTMKDIIESRDLGDVAFRENKFEDAIKYYEAVKTKTTEAKIFSKEGVPFEGLGTEAIDRKIKYSEKILKDIAPKQIQTNADFAELKPNAWAQIDPAKHREMLDLYKKAASGSKLIDETKPIIKITDAGVGLRDLGTIESKLNARAANIATLQSYQNGVAEAKIQKDKMSQIQSQFNSFCTIANSGIDPNALRAEIEALVPEPQKSQFLAQMAGVEEIRPAFEKIDEMGKRLDQMPNAAKLKPEWAAFKAALTRLKGDYESSSPETAAPKKNAFDKKFKEAELFAEKYGDIVGFHYSTALESYIKGEKVKSTPSVARGHLIAASESLDKAQAIDSNDPRISDLRDKIDVLNKEMFSSPATFEKMIGDVAGIVEKFKTNPGSRKEYFEELANSFVGLGMALGDSHPEYRNSIVKTQSGETSFTKYLNCLFDPTQANFYTKAYEKMASKDNKIAILKSAGVPTGYTVAELTAVLKKLPSNDPQIKKLNALFRQLSYFFMDPIAGDMNILEKTNTAPDTDKRFWTQRVIYGVSDLFLSEYTTNTADQAMALRNTLNGNLPEDQMKEIENKFGAFRKSDKYRSPAQVVAVYLMSMEPAVQKGSVEGVFENDWRIDGEARPHISKYLKGMVDETAIKALRVAEIEKLKNYFSKLNDKNPSVDRKLQIKILEILEEG